jgi:hypothetical protein
MAERGLRRNAEDIRAYSLWLILPGEFPDNAGYHTPWGQESQQQDDGWPKSPENGPIQVDTVKDKRCLGCSLPVVVMAEP